MNDNNKNLLPEERARALLKEMTLNEKIGQLNQRLYGFRIYERKNDEIKFTEELTKEVERYSGLGTLYGLFRADPWSGRTYENGLSGALAVKAYNQLQKYVIEHSRLRIPVLLSSECPHGHQALDGYVLPVNLAVGATFHPRLLREAGEVAGKQMKSMGVNLALVSALDILRDPRWGRSEECYGEDPYLAGCFGTAMIEGIQSQGVSVVAKHFCAQGETAGGVNASPAAIGERELREIHLPPAKACCKAGVKGIMAAYNEIDGVYCHGNVKLLKKILREEFGFDGVVMADGVAIDQLDTITGDNVRSAALALKSGVDIGLWDQGYSHLEKAVERGLMKEEEIEQAVLRVLKLKFEMGLFEKPYIGEDGERTSQYSEVTVFQRYDYKEYMQSQKLAEESVILLKNKNNLLPIVDMKKSIALIGPNADDIYRQIGDYSPPVKEGRTVRESLKNRFLENTIRYADGKSLVEARKAAEESDIIVLVLGGSSSRFEGADFDSNGAVITDKMALMDCGEGVDVSNLELPGNQNEVFAMLRSLNIPMVTVIIAGRPYAIQKISEETDALLYSFYPGPMGGEAIAKIICGEISPSGRLPVSIPRSPGQIPVYYNYKKSYRAMHYCDQKEGALYTFGEGFGYSQFEYSDIAIRKSDNGEKCLLECTIKNIGKWDDYSVLQCYRCIRNSEIVPRVRELKAIKKVWLTRGEKKKIAIPIDEEWYQIFGIDGTWKKITEPFTIQLMDSGKPIYDVEI